MRGKPMPDHIRRELGLDALGTQRNGNHIRHTLTDLGNCERFVDQHGQDVRYCHPWAKWLVWDGKRFVPDDAGQVEAKMKATVRSIYAEAAQEEDSQQRKSLSDHAKRSEAKARIADALYLARSEPGIPVMPSDLDANPWLLNCENGTVNLLSGKLQKHRPEDLLTKLAPLGYDPGAKAPTLEAFLERILPSEALRKFVKKVIGYAATGTVSEEILVILHGSGANGKSTLVNVVMEALGDYAMQAAPDLLLAKRGSHPTELADLFGARFVASVETDEGRRLAEGLVKQLTGRDPIKARRMREDFWQFDPTHTAFLATNHKPEVRGTDHAIWRRIKLVPFDVTIPEAEQDRKLAEKLRAELPGILRWIVEGCLAYQTEGLGEPQEVKDATQDYRSEQDVLAAFVEERCVLHPKASIGTTPLYEAYKAWCEETGESQLTQTKFALRLKERGFRKEKVGTVTWYGLGLVSNLPDPDEPGGFRDDSPEGKSPIGKGDTTHSVGDPGGFGPKKNIHTPISLRVGVIPEKGPNPPNRPQPSTEDDGDAGRFGPSFDSQHPPIGPAGNGGNTDSGGRLTPEEADRVKRRIHEGMKPDIARAEVLAKRGKGGGAA